MQTETKNETKVSPQIQGEILVCAYACKVGGDSTAQRILGLIAEHTKRAKGKSSFPEFLEWFGIEYENLIAEQNAIGNIDKNLNMPMDLYQQFCGERASFPLNDSCARFEGRKSGKKDARSFFNTTQEFKRTVRQIVTRYHEMSKTKA